MDKLADQLFILEGNGKVKTFFGSYIDYREQEKLKKKNENKTEVNLKVKPINEPNQENQGKQKMTNKEKFEFQNLDKEIANLEKQKAELTEKLGSGIIDHKELSDTSIKLGEVSRLLDEKQLRWLELSEMAG
jgi:ATP-binding cassette subfamily F protein uup